MLTANSNIHLSEIPIIVTRSITPAFLTITKAGNYLLLFHAIALSHSDSSRHSMRTESGSTTSVALSILVVQIRVHRT